MSKFDKELGRLKERWRLKKPREKVVNLRLSDNMKMKKRKKRKKKKKRRKRRKKKK